MSLKRGSLASEPVMPGGSGGAGLGANGFSGSSARLASLRSSGSAAECGVEPCRALRVRGANAGTDKRIQPPPRTNGKTGHSIHRFS